MDDITTPKQGNTNRKQEKPKWIVNLKNNVETIRNCPCSGYYKLQKERKFTKHQNTILHRLIKNNWKYKNENIGNLTSFIKTRPEK